MRAGHLIAALAVLVPVAGAASAGWGIDFLGAPAAWAGGATGAGVRVAIVDTGVTASHPYLVGHVDWATSVCPLAPSPTDVHGHGTRMAGIVRQMAPDARLYSVRALGPTGGLSGCIPGNDVTRLTTFRAHLVHAMLAAARGPDGALGTADDADVVLASIEFALPGGAALAMGPDSFAEAAAEGILFVGAAGNHRADAGVTWPAAEPSVIAVGAIGRFQAFVGASAGGTTVGFPIAPNVGPFPEHDWVLPESSNGVTDGRDSTVSYGEIELVAPGLEIETAALNGGTTVSTGTSPAAAHVAGALALAVSAGADDPRAALRCTAVDIVARGKLTAPGYDVSSGYGWPDLRRLAECA